MSDLDTLIRDLEAATEGNRELDGRILLASGWHIDNDGYWWAQNGNLGFHGEREAHLLPNPTTSLDAAREIVPKRFRHHWSVTEHHDRSGATVGDLADGAAANFKGATPALALCIASIKTQNAT